MHPHGRPPFEAENVPTDVQHDDARRRGRGKAGRRARRRRGREGDGAAGGAADDQRICRIALTSHRRSSSSSVTTREHQSPAAPSSSLPLSSPRPFPLSLRAAGRPSAWAWSGEWPSGACFFFFACFGNSDERLDGKGKGRTVKTTLLNQKIK